MFSKGYRYRPDQRRARIERCISPNDVGCGVTWMAWAAWSYKNPGLQQTSNMSLECFVMVPQRTRALCVPAG